MELQRSGNTTRIMLAAALAAAVVAYDASLVVYLVIAGHFPAFWSSDTLMIAVSALFSGAGNVRRLLQRADDDSTASAGASAGGARSLHRRRGVATA